MQLQKLDFPETYNFLFRKDKDKIFIYDSVRKIYVLLTPEEWVRQHWIHYYLHQKNHAASAIITEKKLLINGVTKRLDLLITEKTLPKILVECKAPSIKLTKKTFEQIARYNSTIKAPKIVLSNGLHHISADFLEDGSYQFVNFNF